MEQARTQAAFRRTVEPEPHLARRRRILAEHPGIRALYGYDRRTGFITLGVVVAQLGVAALVGRAHRLWLDALVAYAVGAFAHKWSGVAIHESAHNLVARTTVGNRLLALIANVPLLVPSAMSFRRHHMTHHTYLGVVGRDNDLASRWEIEWVGGAAWRKLVWLTFYAFFGVLARRFLERPNRWEWANLALQLTVDVALLLLLGGHAVTYLALSTFFGYGLHPVAGHFIHEHYLWHGEQETYSYYGPLNRLTLNLGYHNEHHDFMRVPSSRLPLVRRIAASHYAPLRSHDSWAWVMWHFVVTPSLGHDARLSRSWQTFLRSRGHGEGEDGRRGASFAEEAARGAA